MKNILLCLVLMTGIAAVGCGGNACEDAVDKLEDECEIDLMGGIDEDAAEDCNAEDECTADCVNDASCSEIEAALGGESNSFASCLAECIQ